jgi:hypothetical protein
MAFYFCDLGVEVNPDLARAVNGIFRLGLEFSRRRARFRVALNGGVTRR